MKGAFVISQDAGLFEAIVGIMTKERADYSEDNGGMVQMTDGEGRLFTIYPVDAEYAYEYKEGPFVPADKEVEIPDMGRATACAVECRWEDLFVQVIGQLAARLSSPLWVLDNRNLVWNARDIDPKRVAL